MSISGAVVSFGPATVSTNRVITGETSIVTQPSSAICGVRAKTVPMVIGGLIQNERYKTQRKVPILGDIPLLGYAFRGVYDYKRRTELVIFITPTIVR